LAEQSLPYVPSYGSITKALDRIKKASTPTRFTQDFLATKLDMPGGSPKPLIPFLKRTGFLASDGTPTSLYQRFRNDAQTGAAAAEALRIGYRPLYEINEYIHAASDSEIKGAIVQATGAKNNSSTVKVILGSFKALRDVADFDADPADVPIEPDGEVTSITSQDGLGRDQAGLPAGLSLGYTINLHLPATSDVSVFNAIFKSLREHLLR
jgi:hypothetical protein